MKQTHPNSLKGIETLKRAPEYPFRLLQTHPNSLKGIETSLIKSSADAIAWQTHPNSLKGIETPEEPFFVMPFGWGRHTQIP